MFLVLKVKLSPFNQSRSLSLSKGYDCKAKQFIARIPSTSSGNGAGENGDYLMTLCQLAVVIYLIFVYFVDNNF